MDYRSPSPKSGLPSTAPSRGSFRPRAVDSDIVIRDFEAPETVSPGSEVTVSATIENTASSIPDSDPDQCRAGQFGTRFGGNGYRLRVVFAGPTLEPGTDSGFPNCIATGESATVSRTFTVPNQPTDVLVGLTVQGRNSGRTVSDSREITVVRESSPPTGSPCQSNADCPPGTVCIPDPNNPTERVCQPGGPDIECRDNGDCRADQICENGECVPLPGPGPDPDPEPSPEPDPEPSPDPEPEPSPEPSPDPSPSPDPEPEPSPSQCSSNAGCPPGEVCVPDPNDSTRRICQPGGPDIDCREDADCSGGQICENGACVDPPGPSGCRSDADCPQGQTCRNGQCRAGGGGITGYWQGLSQQEKFLVGGAAAFGTVALARSLQN